MSLVHKSFAGRIVPAGVTVAAQLAMPRGGGRLIARLAPEKETRVTVRVGGRELEALTAAPSTGRWREATIALPAGLPARARVELTAEG